MALGGRSRTAPDTLRRRLRALLYAWIARAAGVSRTERRPLWQDLYRGYDIRGRYPLEIDPRTARRLGVAVARAFPGPFLIGRDTRRESERFARELERGLRSEGTFVERIGIVPTPEVAFLARSRRSFGLAVTPSHKSVGYVCR